ncbi:flagellar hook assembly protein FlgD [Thiobacillus denitrificans]|uniref:Basal-body rod modification protein FlgD n=1 Tax=Thiobacillus denitrificans TaxID=36861 RepID=A0A119CW70_THIDE|nr:flagellar hook assembly protein FlgD [Thiobacillus denitrificans]KVW96106.1 flagellar basal body rod modification protein [Thiobacillus denitrificans]
MTTVQDASNVSSLFGAGAAKATKNGTKETEDRFLTLLVAQMKNQDPLNPLDNAQVTSQLAQLSTVQGIENMNTTLQSLATSMGVNQMAQAANLIGRAVLVPGDSISPAQMEDVIGFDLSRPADKVTVDILDAGGGVVRSLDLGPREDGVNVLAWDGLTSNGAAAPDGAYSFKINAAQGGQPVSSTALHLGLVNSVSQGSQGVQLNLAGNESVSYAEIRQIF